LDQELRRRRKKWSTQTLIFFLPYNFVYTEKKWQVSWNWLAYNLGSDKFPSTDGGLYGCKYNQMWVSKIFLKSTKVYEGCKDIKLGQHSIKLDNWKFNSCFMFIVTLNEEGFNHKAITFKGTLCTCK